MRQVVFGDKDLHWRGGRHVISPQRLGTSGNVAETNESNQLLHRKEKDVLGDAGYQAIKKYPDAKRDVAWCRIPDDRKGAC